jgi:hypothetical protein
VSQLTLGAMLFGGSLLVVLHRLMAERFELRRQKQPDPREAVEATQSHRRRTRAACRARHGSRAEAEHVHSIKRPLRVTRSACCPIRVPSGLAGIRLQLGNSEY